jgi:uncharacterized repeat protein (TIGR03803 family)
MPAITLIEPSRTLASSTTPAASKHKRIPGTANQLSAWKTVRALFLFCATTVIASPAQVFTTLASFDGTDGDFPRFGSLVQGFDGSFYGTTWFGGTYGAGTVFKITPGGTLTAIYSFCAQTNCADGSRPTGGLLLNFDGNFYGTTSGGGAYGDNGTIFRITPGGKLTTLHSFNGIGGSTPTSALVQGFDGNLYGTTIGGGVTPYCSSCGTFFRITAGGAFARLYNFCSQANCSDGLGPWGGLVAAPDGKLYGTANAGGANAQSCPGASDPCGTVFSITLHGKLTTLHNFDGTDGANPKGTLVEGTHGNFYGTTYAGGANTCQLIGCGTAFKITLGGTLTVLHNFTESSDGAGPVGALIQGSDGNFYGTTSYGTSSNGGTVFKITSAGSLTTLVTLVPPSGNQPNGGLVEGTDGNLYGTTTVGGASNQGTVFSLGVGFSPFVEAVPASGKLGAAITILGTNLTGATAVRFNSVAATFTVVSASEISTTVPAGATTGKIQVATPSATLSSNVAFRVTPQVLSFSPTSGAVGTSVTITGKSLTGASAVSFGGVLATSFTVNSGTQITATVPTGAKTGVIAVRTLGGRGQSSTSFTVTP